MIISFGLPRVWTAKLISPELFRFWKCFDPRIETPNHGANLESRDARLISWNLCMTFETTYSQAYAINIILIWKVMNPFIPRWDEPFEGKEKHVFNIRLHGLNSDRVVRSPVSIRPVHAGLQLYFTLASVARKEIMVRFIGKRTLWRQQSNHVFHWSG